MRSLRIALIALAVEVAVVILVRFTVLRLIELGW